MSGISVVCADDIRCEWMKKCIDELEHEGCISSEDAIMFREHDFLLALAKEYEEDEATIPHALSFDDMVELAGEVVMRYKSDDDAEVE